MPRSKQQPKPSTSHYLTQQQLHHVGLCTVVSLLLFTSLASAFPNSANTTGVVAAARDILSSSNRRPHMSIQQLTQPKPELGHHVVPRQVGAEQWYPSKASGACQGEYVISGVNNGFITTDPSGANYQSNAYCVWKILAPPGSVIKLTFRSFHTECGWDYLTVYDGDSINAPEMVELCGFRSAASGYDDTMVSTGNMTVKFESDVDIDARGVLAEFTVLEKTCATRTDCSNSGECVNGTCVCDAFFSGPLCNQRTTGFGPFTPREFHSSAYDAASDVMYISFGRDDASFMKNLLIYNFGNNAHSDSFHLLT
ncbi:hypothetical protein HK104_009264 [Borealophlyctis nickersoniae]|nr:hypothetical protein HK104_009264 [Borealophlyctis nickersoniae]